jgi:hypothetical protein
MWPLSSKWVMISAQRVDSQNLRKNLRPLSRDDDTPSAVNHFEIGERKNHVRSSTVATIHERKRYPENAAGGG